MERKTVTKEQYAEVLRQYQDKVYHIALKGWQIPILHGLIALAADHPGIKMMGWPTKQLIAQVRWWCREKISEWGFTPEEVEYLDKSRVEEMAMVQNFKIDWEQATSTTINNLIEAGVLLPGEAETYRETLETYDPATRLKVLMTSHELKVNTAQVTEVKNVEKV